MSLVASGPGCHLLLTTNWKIYYSEETPILRNAFHVNFRVKDENVYSKRAGMTLYYLHTKAKTANCLFILIVLYLNLN